MQQFVFKFLALLGSGHTLTAPSPSPSPSYSLQLTQSLLSVPLASGISVRSCPFVPFPSPFSELPIPYVYPLTSPNPPPPVDNPALVPDFASAWANAYEMAKAKRAMHWPHVSTCCGATPHNHLTIYFIQIW
ncbi:hypothetical protein EDB84DRAFT_1523627 [Lactarius hengduanensis]|nr:hypothetical protein EDB84DRAFT_1523627 [Lactarius hengduanensis]